MGVYLNPGNDAFQISVNDDIYVDKSGLIAFVNNRIGKSKRFICVSRPRRFGKSMAATMLSAYYDRSCDSENLFSNLEIAAEESYKKYLNQYDVIFLNIQQFLRKAGTPERLTQYLEEKVLAELKEKYGDWIAENESSLPDALARVYSKETRTNKGFVFIVDEWDCIFREAKENIAAQKMYLDFLKDLFKDRTYVKIAYMTGILPIKKYGTHSALNIFDEFSMTAPGRLAKYVGFTETEVKNLCKDYDKPFPEAKKWYDGYRFKQASHVYNPKSVVDAMTEGEFRSFWTSTETYQALQIYIDLDMDGMKQAIISMLAGGSCSIDSGSFQNDMMSFRSKDDVLTLMVHLGYLAYNETESKVFIPNEEVRSEFLRAVRNGKRPELVKAIQESDRLLDATIRMDADEVARLIEEVHSANTAPDMYNNEQSLRAVIMLAYISRIDDYSTIQELPSGNGYADMVFLPKKHSHKPAMVVELKWNHSAEGAIAQIKDKKYVEAIENYGGEILLVGINYDRNSRKHTCVIEKYCKK